MIGITLFDLMAAGCSLLNQTANKERPETSKVIPSPKNRRGDESAGMKIVVNRSRAVALKLPAASLRAQREGGAPSRSVTPPKRVVAGSFASERNVRAIDTKMVASDAKKPMAIVNDWTCSLRNDDPIAATHTVCNPLMRSPA
jgi:hypothetical protein